MQPECAEQGNARFGLANQFSRRTTSPAVLITPVLSGSAMPSATGGKHHGEFWCQVLTAAKKALDVTEFQFQPCWSTVIALPGVWRRLHFPQECVHFCDVKPTT